MRNVVFAIVILSAVLAAATNTQSAELITNGGFEAGLTGWTRTCTDPRQAYVQSEWWWRVHDGAYAVDFNSYATPPEAVLSQTIASTAGKSYDVSFYFGVAGWVNTVAGLRYEVVGADGSTVLSSRSLVLQASREGATYTWPDTVNWLHVSDSFRADGASVTFRFTDQTPAGDNNSYCDGLLDSVSVTASAVPEPTALVAWSSLGIVGAFVAWRRRRMAVAPVEAN